MRIQAKVAIVLFLDFLSSIDGRGAGAVDNPDLHGFPDEGTRQGRDEQPGGMWIVLRMLRVLEPNHIPRVLDHHMLEPSTGTEEGPVELAGEPNAVEGTLHALVRAARSAQERVKPLQCPFDPACKRSCRQPLHAGCDSRAGGSVVQGPISRNVRARLRIVVADYANSHRGRHIGRREVHYKRLASQSATDSNGLRAAQLSSKGRGLTVAHRSSRHSNAVAGLLAAAAVGLAWCCPGAVFMLTVCFFKGFQCL